MAESSQKATLKEATSGAIEEAQSVIRKALNQEDVPLSQRLFQDNYRVLIERKKAIGPDGRPIQTRVDEPPIIFELYKQGESCFILDTRNQKQYKLTQANCKVME